MFSFSKNGTKVSLKVDSKIEQVEKRYYRFDFELNDENYAELLKEKLQNEFDKFKEIVASQAIYILPARKLSILKKQLKKWNSKEEKWNAD